MCSRIALMISPLGPVGLVSNARGELLRVHLLGADDPLAWLETQPLCEHDDASAPEARRQLDEYFAGARRQFDLALADDNGTEFQRRVWAELRGLPYGRTISYGELAARLGLPASASRAVGAANGANPHAIVTPCHRVIGSKGELVGYAGGLELKRRLLEHEGALLAL